MELTSKPKLIISKKLQDEIDFLHQKQGGNEWSGELITREIGTINDLDNWTIVAESMFLADLGSPGFTGYEVDRGGFKSVDIVEMYEAFPGLENGTHKNHHIHTHHRMTTFFSDTDWANLNDRSLVSNYFIMLIVNIAGCYCAKVAFRSKRSNDKGAILEFANNHDELKPIKLNKPQSDDVLVIMDLEISAEVPNVEETFVDRWKRVDEAVKKEAEEKKKLETTKVGFQNSNGGWINGRGWLGRSGDKIGFWKNGIFTPEEKVPKEEDYEWNYNSHSGFYTKKEGEKDKKTMEMTDKEWERFQTEEKDGVAWAPEHFEIRHAKMMFNYILKEELYSVIDCRDIFVEAQKMVAGNPKKLERISNRFVDELEDAYQTLFSGKNGSDEFYFELLGKMKEYATPYGYIGVVRAFLDEIETEIETTREALYDDMSSYNHLLNRL